MPGTVKAADDFDAGARAEELKNAMDGLGTNEAAIIDIIDNHDNEQRNKIAVAYKQSFGEDLIEDLKGELGGNFEDTVIALMTPPRLYDVKELRRAVSGMGTDDTALIEIMCSRTNEQLQEIKELYKTEYETDLEADLYSDTSGDFRRMLIALCAGGREDNEDVDWGEAQTDADKFYEAGAGCLGTEESDMNAILCLRSPTQLRAIMELYENKAGQAMERAIENETSCNLQSGFLAIVRYARDPVRFFVSRIRAALDGCGTNDSDLIRLIVSRSEVDLDDIRNAYEAELGVSLAEAIENDCSGDYKRMLLRLLH